MTFTMNVKTSNAAFTDTADGFDPGPELARILRDVADRMEGGYVLSGSVFDINGNKVGSFETVAD